MDGPAPPAREHRVAAADGYELAASVYEVPAECGLPKLGDTGFFRPGAEALWTEVTGWLRCL